MQGPDGAIVEYLGDQPVERMNHVHMWQEQPFCAQLWYRKHLNAIDRCRAARPRRRHARRPTARWRAAPTAPGRRSVREGTFRTPRRRGRVRRRHARPGTCARARRRSSATRGQLYDHIGLSVDRSRRLGRQAARRRDHVPARALRARRHPCRDDPRSQPRSAGAGRDQIERELRGQPLYVPSSSFGTELDATGLSLLADRDHRLVGRLPSMSQNFWKSGPSR